MTLHCFPHCVSCRVGLLSFILSHYKLLKIFAQNSHMLLRIDYISTCVIHFKCTLLLKDIISWHVGGRFFMAHSVLYILCAFIIAQCLIQKCQLCTPHVPNCLLYTQSFVIIHLQTWSSSIKILLHVWLLHWMTVFSCSWHSFILVFHKNAMLYLTTLQNLN